jgi:two-component system cell cycle response regulator
MKSFPTDLEAMVTIAAAVLDAKGVLLEANAGFLRLLPPGCGQPVGAIAARFFIQPPFSALCAAPADPGKESYRGLMTIGDYEGKTRTLLGRVWRTCAGVRVLAEYDIAELERLNDAMLDLNREASDARQALARANVALRQREAQSALASLTDALTGLGNRRRLDEALAIEIGRAVRTGGKLGAVMADIDHFKRVNDRYGHGAGDKVLARVGALLKSQTRATDIVARFGGEEFMVLMPLASLEQSAAKAEQLRRALSAQPIDPLPEPVTASFGVAELRTGEDAESFLERVDAALYAAKRGGRDRVVAAAIHPET